jgi:aspartate aminotransferase
MKLSIENLNEGIKWWREGKWPKDYLNHEYYDIYKSRAAGLTERWAEATLERLVRWKALRSSKPGNTKAKFARLIEIRLPDLQTEYQRLLEISGDEPSIRSLAWQDISKLYETIAEMKDGSPVFASKLGHFIFPNVFIVMDNLGTQVIDYDSYWPGMVDEWNVFQDKDATFDLLKNEIERHSRDAAHPLYPYETKIIELCHIGDKQKKTKKRRGISNHSSSARQFQPPPFLRGIEKSMIRKISDRAKPGSISLGLGEPDLPTPEVIVREAVRVIQEEKSGYTLQAGIPALRERIAGDYPHLNLNLDQIIVTAGSQEALYLILRTLVEEGDEVLIPNPGFIPYSIITRMVGGRATTYRLRAANDFGFDVEDFKSKLSAQTKLVICISPSNPTGRVLSKNDLKTMADAVTASGSNAFIVSDEIYRELYYTPERPPSISEFYPRTIVVNGLSKSMRMTGWRIGWLAGDEAVMKAALVLHGYVVTCASSISQKAALAAWTDEAAAAREEYRAIFLRRREHLLGLLRNDLSLRCVTPEGAFYTMVDVSKYGDEMRVAEAGLDQGVVTIPAAAFGDESKGYLRISFCADEDRLSEGVRRLGAALKSLGQQ